MKDTDQFIPESLRPSVQPRRGMAVNLSEPDVKPGGANPVSIQSLGFLALIIAAVILGVALFAYDVGVDGTVNLGKLNDRLCWVITGTGLGLGGLLLLVLSRLEVISRSTMEPR